VKLICTTELSEFLPHSGEMVWIDQVISPGVCLVKVDREKHYFSQGVVRQSAYIEWIAQSYGFSRAYEKHLDGGKSNSLSKAYLVSFNKAVFSEQSIKDQDEVIVEVSLVKELDDISVVSGKVFSRDKKVMFCEAFVKLYAN
jgi:predicted hotdog family 3-hydroxylacyl-ACP dehydratase